MHRQSRKAMWTLFYCVVVLWMSILACSSGSVPQPTPEPSPIELVTLCDQPENAKLYECDLVIIIRSLDKNLNIRVVAQSDGGILFKEQAQTSLSSDRKKATVVMSLLPNEERRIVLPYEVAPRTLLSGEYIVHVEATEDGSSVVIFDDYAKVFIRTQVGQSPELLPTQETFDEIVTNNFKYVYSYDAVSVNDSLSIFVELADVPDPTTGQLFIKINSKENNYNPTVVVEIESCVKFETAPTVSLDTTQLIATGKPGVINLGGSRILRIPFHLDQNSLDGVCSVLIISKTNSNDLRTDMASIQLVKSSSTTKNQAWLSTNEVNLLPTPTPVPPLITGEDMETLIDIGELLAEEGLKIGEELLDQNEPVIVTSVNANLRRGPDIAYGIIDVLPIGTRINVIGVSNPSNPETRWFKVQAGDIEGWLHDSVVEPVDSSVIKSLSVIKP